MKLLMDRIGRYNLFFFAPPPPTCADDLSGLCFYEIFTDLFRLAALKCASSQREPLAMATLAAACSSEKKTG